MMELFNQTLSLQIVVTDKHMYYKTSSLASMVANMEHIPWKVDTGLYHL